MIKNGFSHLTPGLCVAALVLASGSLLWAQSPNIISIDDSPDATSEQGRVVKIAPDNTAAPSNSRNGAHIKPIPAATRFWIGLAGRPLNNRLLREHLQLPAGQVSNHAILCWWPADARSPTFPIWLNSSAREKVPRCSLSSSAPVRR